MSRDRPRFSGAEILRGMRLCLPLLVGLTPFGIVCGVVSQGQGLSLGETTLMSVLCYAGSAQLLALSHWGHPAPILAATFAAFVVNLRLALMGPVLAGWLDRLRGWRLWGTLFLMADQNWAMSVTEMQSGRGDAGFLFGSGVMLWLMWAVATALGWALGSTIQPPPGHPLFFAALGVFVAMLVVMWRGRSDLLPWATAAAAAVVAAWLMPGTSWYIVIGALAGSTAGALRDTRRI